MPYHVVGGRRLVRQALTLHAEYRRVIHFVLLTRLRPARGDGRSGGREARTVNSFTEHSVMLLRRQFWILSRPLTRHVRGEDVALVPGLQFYPTDWQRGAQFFATIRHHLHIARLLLAFKRHAGGMAEVSIREAGTRSLRSSRSLALRLLEREVARF